MTDKAPDAMPYAAINETLSYYDEEFPLDKYPTRESWPVSRDAGGVTVGHLRALQAIAAQMAEENKRLRAALSFYAEESLYDYVHGAMSCNPQLILQDRGNKARAALKGE